MRMELSMMKSIFNSPPSGLVVFSIPPHARVRSLLWGVAIAGTRSRNFSAFGTLSKSFVLLALKSAFPRSFSLSKIFAKFSSFFFFNYKLP